MLRLLTGTLLAATAALAAPANACAIIATGGTLALTGDGTAMTSEAGLASTITISTTVLDGPFTITIDPPAWAAYPTNFDMASASLQQRTVSLGTLNMNAGYTSGAISKSFGAQLVSAAVVSLHHRITAARFVDGTYRTRTVVTCS